jgi:O-antigen ligase
MAHGFIPPITVAFPLDLRPGERAEANRESPLHAAARVVLVATLLAAPWAFGAVQPWAWASLAVLAVLALFLWGMGCVQQGALKLAWSPLYWPAFAFLLLAGVQLAFPLTFDRVATRESLLKLAADLIFFFLAGQLYSGTGSSGFWSRPALPRPVAAATSGGPAGMPPSLAVPPVSSPMAGRGKAVRRFGGAVAVFAFVISLFAILQYLTSHGLIYWSVKSRGWTFGPYVNRNHYGGLMEMLIPICIASFLSRRSPDPFRGILGFALLFPIASLLLSGSRGAFVCLVLQILIMAAILIRRSSRGSRRSLAFLVVLGIVAVGSLFWWVDSGVIARRLATVITLPRSPEVKLSDRVGVSRSSLRILRDHPWLGTGLGSFEVAFPPYEKSPTDYLWDHAHDDYAEALAETGLVGGLLIISALIIFLRLAFRELDARLRHRAGWIQLGAATGCCGLLLHSFVDFNFHIPANAAWFAVCAALATLPTPAASLGSGRR